MATFDNGFILQSFELPARTQAGATLEISFTWQSDVAGTEDHVQFLHLGHEESGEWWVYDQQPLEARLPTRLWYSGLVDSEVWQVPLPADLAPGRYHVFTGLYRISDQERVPDAMRKVSLFSTLVCRWAFSQSTARPPKAIRQVCSTRFHLVSTRDRFPPELKRMTETPGPSAPNCCSDRRTLGVQ